MDSFLTLNCLPQDGIGSLLEYILGTFFFCEKYNLEYVHKKIEKIEHNTKQDEKEWIDFWDNNIRNIFLPNVKNLEKVSHLKFIILEKLSFILLRNVVYQLNNRDYLKDILSTEQTYMEDTRNKIVRHFHQNTFQTDFKNKINAAIHIRRFLETDCDKSDWREYYEKGNFMDNYFQQVIKELLKFNKDIHIHIYSQGPKELFQHFTIFSNSVFIHTDQDAMHDLIHLSKADILVMSRGSYSRIANFYSNNIKLSRGKTDSNPCWPLLSKNTFFVSNNGTFSDEIKKAINDIV